MQNKNKTIYHFTYKIIHIPTGKYYIGKRTTSNLNDGYMGSGIHIKRAIAKHGIEEFVLNIICYYESSKLAFEAERILVTKEVVSDPLSYNLKIGGKGGSIEGRKSSEETCEKLSKMRMGHSMHENTRAALEISNRERILSEESRSKLAKSAMGNKRCLGRILSEESRSKIAETLKGNVPVNKGKKMSDEFKAKVSAAALKRSALKKQKLLSESVQESEA